MGPSSTLVIGASSSIGYAIVKPFLEHDKTVMATYNTQKPSSQSHPSLEYVQLDLTSEKSCMKFTEKLRLTETEFDTIIFLPSIIYGRPLEEYSDPDMEKIMEVNFTAQAKFIRNLLPLMAQKSCLILMGSIAAERGSFDPIYAASKGAFIPFSKSLARAYGKRLSTITLLPGPIMQSKMYNDMSPKTQLRHQEQNPRGELLNMDDLGKVVYDLSQSHWRHANGAIIRLNGGAYV